MLDPNSKYHSTVEWFLVTWKKIKSDIFHDWHDFYFVPLACKNYMCEVTLDIAHCLGVAQAVWKFNQLIFSQHVCKIIHDSFIIDAFLKLYNTSDVTSA